MIDRQNNDLNQKEKRMAVKGAGGTNGGLGLFLSSLRGYDDPHMAYLNNDLSLLQNQIPQKVQKRLLQ